MERAITLTLDFVKERKAFGQRVLDFQNTKFKLAECKTDALIARTFVDQCLIKHLAGELDASTASMAKYWTTDKQNQVIEICLQLHGGAGYMEEYPISHAYVPRRSSTNDLRRHQRNHERTDQPHPVGVQEKLMSDLYATHHTFDALPQPADHGGIRPSGLDSYERGIKAKLRLNQGHSHCRNPYV